jgi:hypothetical protein
MRYGNVDSLPITCFRDADAAVIVSWARFRFFFRPRDNRTIPPPPHDLPALQDNGTDPGLGSRHASSGMHATNAPHPRRDADACWQSTHAWVLLQ